MRLQASGSHDTTAAERTMKQKVKLSTYSVIVSILGIATLVAVIFFAFEQNHEGAACYGITALVFMLVMALIYVPLSISVKDDKLTVNRIIFPKSIPLADIKSVELCPPTMAEIRICGSGGWLGYWGKFSEPSIGKYFAYYGKASECFLVKLNDGRQYMLGCENPAKMVEFIKKQING